MTETIIQSMTTPNEDKIVKVLLENEMDINRKYEDDGATPLIADAQITANAAQLLIEHGANVNETNNAGLTALILISGKGKPDLVKLLLEKGADVNAQSNNGITPLLSAVRPNFLWYTEESVETVRLLLDAGADKSVKFENGASMIDYLKEAVPHEPVVDEIIKLLEER